MSTFTHGNKNLTPTCQEILLCIEAIWEDEWYALSEDGQADLFELHELYALYDTGIEIEAIRVPVQYELPRPPLFSPS